MSVTPASFAATLYSWSAHLSRIFCLLRSLTLGLTVIVVSVGFQANTILCNFFRQVGQHNMFTYPLCNPTSCLLLMRRYQTRTKQVQRSASGNARAVYFCVFFFVFDWLDAMTSIEGVFRRKCRLS